MRLNILCFAAGILWLQNSPALSDWRLPGAVGLLLFVLSRHVQCRARRLPAMLACLLLGVAWATWRADSRLADELDAAWEGRDVQVVGVVAALPQAFPRGSRFEFDVETVLTAGALVPAHLMLSFYQGRDNDTDESSGPRIRPGERWQLTVRLKRPHGNANPGAFDYEAWLLERNIRATGYVRPGATERLNGFVLRPAYVIERLRDQVRDRFAEMLPAAGHRWAGVLLALAIGDQRAIQGELWTIFNRAGITHLVSISGLHVTMVAALAGGLCGWGWRRVPALALRLPALALRLPAQRAALLVACGTALLYSLLAGFAVPAQRTAYMLCVAALCVLSGRQLAPSRTLCLALLVVLLIDPWAVLAAGFWLSFAAVGVLLYVSAAQVGKEQHWRGQLRTWGAVQWAATLASLPILLLVFQQFSLVSPLANAVAIPVVSFVVTPLALLGALVPWWPILALAHQVMDWLMLFIVWCATWPVWQAPAPPVPAAVLAGVGVVICLLPRGVPGRALGIVFLLPALFWPAERLPDGEAWITVLDVGQGLASVVQTRDHVLIYDPGPLYSAESDAGQRVVVPYLRTLGVQRVDMLVITHRDSDHSGGAASVRSALPVDEVRSSMAGIGAVPCLAGQGWTWDGVVFEMLHPASLTVDGKANHVSCVLRVTAGGKKVLLTSDIEAADEAALLERYPGQLAADVLLVPHHGSKTSSTAAFLAAVAAPAAVIPVGYRNAFGHPKAEVLARYAAAGTQLWRTDRDGAVRIGLHADGVSITAWRRAHPRYWHGR